LSRNFCFIIKRKIDGEKTTTTKKKKKSTVGRDEQKCEGKKKTTRM
jgi:hypothetical protein